MLLWLVPSAKTSKAGRFADDKDLRDILAVEFFETQGFSDPQKAAKDVLSVTVQIGWDYVMDFSPAYASTLNIYATHTTTNPSLGKTSDVTPYKYLERFRWATDGSIGCHDLIWRKQVPIRMVSLNQIYRTLLSMSPPRTILAGLQPRGLLHVRRAGYKYPDRHNRGPDIAGATSRGRNQLLHSRAGKAMMEDVGRDVHKLVVNRVSEFLDKR